MEGGRAQRQCDERSRLETGVIFRASRLGLMMTALVLMGACNSGSGEPAYVTLPAEIGDVRDIVPATGVLVDEQAAEIRAPKAGVVSAVLVQEGDTVVAGQVLARLSDAARTPVGEAATTAASAMDGAIEEARLKLKAAEAVLSRRRTLQASQFSSAAAVEDAAMDVALAQTVLQNALSAKRAADARVRVAIAEASQSDIVAPLAGVVTLVGTRVGQRVSPEDARAMFQTTKGAESLSLEIMIPEPDMSRVSMDSSVWFTVDAYPGVRNEAAMVSIGRAPIREGRFVSYRGLARYDNIGGRLLAGMTASVELVRADSRRVLRVPARALYFRPPNYMPPTEKRALDRLMREHNGDMRLVRAGADGAEYGRLLREGKRLMFVLENGQPARREVRIGAQTEEFVEVTSGMRPGDIVIIDDAQPEDAP